MKAKKVYEFQQGQDPYDTMKIGSEFRPFTVGDKFRIMTDFFFCEINDPTDAEMTSWDTTQKPNGRDSYIIKKNTIVTVLAFIDDNMLSLGGTPLFYYTNLNSPNINYEGKDLYFYVRWFKEHLGTNIKRIA
jgi:hypothetical protein